MINPGHIRIIARKVYFEYYLLEKPKPICGCDSCSIRYRRASIECKASKQLIKVVNVEEAKTKWFYKYRCGYKALAGKMVVNNQPCKAEVIGDTCTIVELN